MRKNRNYQEFAFHTLRTTNIEDVGNNRSTVLSKRATGNEVQSIRSSALMVFFSILTKEEQRKCVYILLEVILDSSSLIAFIFPVEVKVFERGKDGYGKN